MSEITGTARAAILDAELARVVAESEGRRRELLRCSEERAAEWKRAENAEADLATWRSTAAAALAQVERYGAVVEAATAYNDGVGKPGEAERLAALFDAVDALRALENER